MGLDQCAYTLRVAPAASVDFVLAKESREIYYWRNHLKLHAWMHALYVRKGGRDKRFNCSQVVLDSSDLDRLESDVAAFRVSEIRFFFFRQYCGDERNENLGFIEKARAAIAEGKTVFYSAS